MRRMIRVTSKHRGVMVFLALLAVGLIWTSAVWAPGYPPPGDEGCTPGFWRNHLDEWAATAFSPADDFDSIFGVDLFDPDITLEEAIWARGGGVNKLARHGTAALLSAAHPDVNSVFTVGTVIWLVQSGEADVLAQANELGCPL
jgi:hypothetical protein